MSQQGPELKCKHILSRTAASVSTGLFFCLQPKMLSGEKGSEALGELSIEGAAMVFTTAVVTYDKAEIYMEAI